MTDLELIFTMLGEASTTEIARNRDAQEFDENLEAAVEGGTVAGSARKDLERKSGNGVSTRENFKEIPEAEKRKQITRHAGMNSAELSCHAGRVLSGIQGLCTVEIWIPA